MNSLYIYFFVMLAATFVITVLATKKLIPILKSKKLGQKILDIGPRWHKSKEGTPTMGGLAFLIPITAVGAILLAVYGVLENTNEAIGGALVLFLALSNGIVGIIDDRTKFAKNQNEGLTAKQKYLLQLLCAGLFLFGMKICGFIDESMHIPFTDITIKLGAFYYIIALLLITGVVNSVNLTDGVDGLVSSITFVVSAFLFAASIKTDNLPLAIMAGGVMGGTLGFLVYNFYPARIFMGDTGSLFLGGMISGCSFLMAEPLLVLLFGIIYIVETASVIIQVTSYKLTKKRVFKMSPIHHHFEMCGWGEIKIGIVFSLVTLVFSLISYFAI